MESAREALEAARRIRPDLVLMDLGLPDEGGASVGRKILGELPDTKVVAVTAMNDFQAVRDAMRSGFSGYVTKDTPIAQFVGSLRAALDGQVVIPPRLARQAGGADTPEERQAALLVQQLTPREREVVALLAEGASGQEIARRLSISRNTVRTHIQNILTKFQVHSRLEAVTFAVRHGVVSVPRFQRQG